MRREKGSNANRDSSRFSVRAHTAAEHNATTSGNWCSWWQEEQLVEGGAVGGSWWQLVQLVARGSAGGRSMWEQEHVLAGPAGCSWCNWPGHLYRAKINKICLITLTQ